MGAEENADEGGRRRIVCIADFRPVRKFPIFSEKPVLDYYRCGIIFLPSNDKATRRPVASTG